MAFQINWTERALADLEEIVAFIAADRPDASGREGGEIIRRADFLAGFPHLGPIYRVTEEAEYRSIISGNYRLVYYIKPGAQAVDIVTIRHCARDFADLP